MQKAEITNATLSEHNAIKIVICKDTWRGKLKTEAVYSGGLFLDSFGGWSPPNFACHFRMLVFGPS